MILQIVDKTNQSHGYLEIPEGRAVNDVCDEIDKIKREIREEYELEEDEFDIYDYWDELIEALTEELDVYYDTNDGTIEI